MSETTTENLSERLIVKNFGPLKDVDIELKDIMVFIGPQASGKSTLAKILYLINDHLKLSLGMVLDDIDIDDIDIQENLKRFNINFSSEKTEIYYKIKDFVSCSIKNTKLTFDLSLKTINIFKQIREAIEKLENPSPQIFNNVKKFSFVPHSSNIKKSNINKTSQPVSPIDRFNMQEEAILEHFAEESTYIPAERNTISSLSDSLMGVLAAGVSIPKFILDFGSKFEIARKNLITVYIDFLNITYEHSFGIGNRVFISPEQSISLSEAASGLQSVIPLYLVTKHFAESNLLVIEEPELNLFPETQKKLVEFIIETCRDKTKRLIITTHSPYILTTLNGLIQAHNTARTKPELKDKVAEIVPENRWIDFDKIGVYHVADGTVKRIMDDEYRLIDANPIDDVSDKLGREFDELLDLKYD
ncbi:MAG: hypothetical protein RIT27_1311 [Pseudomonadota bacterium]|jgi:predicted ATP-dependent endonuclease of OLD family